MSSEIVKEGMQTVMIKDIKKTKRPSSYTDEDYTLAFITDEKDRKITAAGRWVEDWQVGDVVAGIMQEKASMRTGGGLKEAFPVSSLFLRNPEARY